MRRETLLAAAMVAIAHSAPSVTAPISLAEYHLIRSSGSYKQSKRKAKPSGKKPHNQRNKKGRP